MERTKQRYNNVAKKCSNCKYYCYENIDCGYVCVNSDSDYCADWVEENNFCKKWESNTIA